MKPEIAKKWIAALESGEYTQTSRVLRRSQDMCCLGVLCDLASKEGVGHWVDDVGSEDGAQYYVKGEFDVLRGDFDNQSAFVLPAFVRDWAGIKSDNGGYKQDRCLSQDNDKGYSFKDIAALIRENIETL